MARKGGRDALPKDHPEERKAILIASLIESGLIMQSCKAAGISYLTAQKWRDLDPDFSQAWTDALATWAESLEKETVRRGRDGVTRPVFQGGKRVGEVQEYSDTLLMFATRAALPEKYRERADINLNGGPMKVKQDLL